MSEDNLILRGIMNWSLGLGFFVYYLILIGSVGYFKPLPVVIFALTILLFGYRNIPDCKQWIEEMIRYCFFGGRGLERFIQFIFFVLILLTGLCCFLPEISNDALAYQLNLPKLFVQTGFIRPIFYDLRSYQSLFMNCLYAVGLLFDNVPIAKFFHWWTGVLLVVSFIVIVHQETKNKKMAMFYGLIFWLTPTVVNQVTVTYVDLGVALYIFLSFYLMKTGIHDGNPLKFFLSGIMLGFAVSCKFLALIALVPTLVVLVLSMISNRDIPAFLKNTSRLLLGVLIGSGYWFIKNYLQTGNPFFPYFGRFFGIEDFEFQSRIYDTLGMPKTLLNFLLTLWNMTFLPHRFDYHHWIGPFYLLNLPLFIYAACFVKKMRLTVIYFLTFTAVWFFMAQLSRYLLPVMPLYLLCSCCGFVHLRNKFRINRMIWVFKTTAFLLGLFLFLLTIYHYRFQCMTIFGIWNRNVYLKKMERTIPIAEWVNQHLPLNVIILNRGDVRQFYFKRSIILEDAFNLRAPEFKKIETVQGMMNFLTNHGITHILNRADIGMEFSNDKTKNNIFLDIIQNDPNRCQPLATVQSENIREAQVIYSICELKADTINT